MLNKSHRKQEIVMSIKNIFRRLKPRKKNPLVFILLFGVVGALVVIFVKAAVYNNIIEPEEGAKNSQVGTVTDSNAAGGSAVQFNNPPSGSGEFTVTNGRIYDPNGAEFVPFGTNVNGVGIAGMGDFNYILNHINEIKQWNWTALRIIICTPSAGCAKDMSNYTATEYAQLDAVVNALSAQGIVTILNAWGGTGCVNQYNDVNAINSFWTAMGNRYKNQTYVWFNIYNEPSNSGFWLTIHTQSIAAIRGTGAHNIVVADSVNCGNDIDQMGTCTLDTSKVPMLNNLNAIKTAANNMNIVHSNHYYITQSQCSDAQNIATQTALINAVRAQNIGFIVGEASVPKDGDFCLFSGYYPKIWNMLEGAAIPLKAGVIAWHTIPISDGCSLTSTNNWWDINNLSPSGARFWNDLH